MFKYNFLLIFLLSAIFSSSAFSQGIIENHQVKIIHGTVINLDTVGSVITIETMEQVGTVGNTVQAVGPEQVAFFVPDKVIITLQTHDIGLMDMRKGDPVTVRYYAASPGKYTVSSIMDNRPVAAE